MTEPQFTEDWVTEHTGLWRMLLNDFAGQPHVHALEIGSYEGRSSIWFLENILTDPTSHLTCVDPFFRDVFVENLRPYESRVSWIRQYSHIALRQLPLQSYSFAYVDGEHTAPAVLEDAIITFRSLVAGGIMIFDDYRWRSEHPDIRETMPGLGIDSFLSVFKREIEVLHKDY
jgi:predicted O-methyltransferase YrrM